MQSDTTTHAVSSASPDRLADDLPFVTGSSLLATINAYRIELTRYNKEAPDDPPTPDPFVTLTYGPPMEALENWEAPAATLLEVVAALRLASEEEDENFGDGMVLRMISAALGYLEPALDAEGRSVGGVGCHG